MTAASDTNPTPTRQVLDKNTLVPIGQLAVMVGMAVGLYGWSKDVGVKLDKLTDAVKGLTASRWTYDDEKNHNQTLQALNPDIVVPPPYRSQPREFR